MCVSVYMHASVYVYVCICVTVCVYMYVCLCLYMCDCEYLCIVRLCVHVPVYLMYMSDCVSTCMCTFGGGKWHSYSLKECLPGVWNSHNVYVG